MEDQKTQAASLVEATGTRETMDADTEALAERLSAALEVRGVLYLRSRGMEVDTQALIQALPQAPERVTWDDLALVSDTDPQGGRALWESIKASARRELRSGYRAAGVLATDRTTPMDRARFLATREALTEEWQPRGGMEQSLIDQMAQSQMLFEHWQKELMTRTQTEAAEDLRLQNKALNEEARWWQYGEWVPPRVSVSEAIQEAANMADRWHRMYLRTLRQLRDLRRYSPVVINNPGQVNFGQQQVNVAPANPNLTCKKQQQATPDPGL